MAPKYSSLRADHIEYAFWLVFSKDGSMRFSRGQPSVDRHERAMSCSATLPKSLFSTPVLSARLEIKDGADTTFSLDVKAVGEALKQVLGVDIDLQIKEFEK